MSITRSRRRVPRKRKAACGPDDMTSRRSAEEQSEAEERKIALRLSAHLHALCAISIKRPIFGPCESGLREDPMRPQGTVWYVESHLNTGG